MIGQHRIDENMHEDSITDRDRQKGGQRGVKREVRVKQTGSLSLAQWDSVQVGQIWSGMDLEIGDAPRMHNGVGSFFYIPDI